MKEKKNTGKQDLNNIHELQAKIKDLNWKVKEITHSRDIWYKKAKEYEDKLFELGYYFYDNNLPF